MAWKQAALCWIFQRCRSAVGRELPFAMVTHWYAYRELNRVQWQSQRKTGTIKITDKSHSVFGTSGRTVWLLVRRALCEWLTEGVPHHPKTEWKDLVASNSQPRDVARRLVSKRLLWLILPVTGVFATFWATKSWERKTWRKFKGTIKVENW